MKRLGEAILLRGRGRGRGHEGGWWTGRSLDDVLDHVDVMDLGVEDDVGALFRWSDGEKSISLEADIRHSNNT